MPITFVSDPQLGLIRTTYIGLLDLADLARYVYMLSERDWLERPQLIDGRPGALTMSPRDVRIFAGLMSTLGRRHRSGPIAFVPGNAVNECVASLYEEYGAGDNPDFATFADLGSAEAWLVEGARA